MAGCGPVNTSACTRTHWNRCSAPSFYGSGVSSASLSCGPPVRGPNLQPPSPPPSLATAPHPHPHPPTLSPHPSTSWTLAQLSTIAAPETEEFRSSFHFRLSGRKRGELEESGEGVNEGGGGRGEEGAIVRGGGGGGRGMGDDSVH